MPVLSIEAPQGIRPEAKRKMMQKLTEAIDEAYHIGDTLIFLREYQRGKLIRIEVENRAPRPRVNESTDSSKHLLNTHFREETDGE